NDAREVLLKTVENLDTDFINKDSVKRAINTLKKRRELEFANSERIAISLSEWRAYGDWRLYFLHRDRLEKVTPEDVLRVAKRYLLQSNRTIGLFEPTESPLRAETPTKPDLKSALAGYKGRAKMSEGEVFEPTPENIDQRTIRGELQSGVKFALLPKKTRGNVVNLTGELNYGNEDNLKGLVSASQLLPSLLSRGTKNSSFQEFKDKLDELSATLNFGGSLGSVTFNIQTKRDNLSQVLELLQEALRSPLLDEEQLDVVRRRMMTQMESMKSNPQGLAANAIQRKLGPYSNDNIRYTPTIEEGIERLSNVKIDDIRKLYEEYLGGSHGYVAVVGDFDTESLITGLNGIFKDWTTKKGYKRVDSPAVEGIKGERVVIETPDKQNAIYIAGTMFPMDDTEIDYEPMLVGNYILGGGPLASRLADRVRKKDGLSYAIGSQFRASSEDPSAMLMMFAISNPSNTENVVNAIDEEVTRFSESGVSGEELEKAKESFLKNRQGRRAQDRGLARILLSNLKNNRSMEFQKESDERIKTLTKAQVDEAFERWFKKENLVIITAGDFAAQEASDDKEKQ
ncbi:MAG: insulinase family protein, partial [Planctomycetota bacterium]